MYLVDADYQPAINEPLCAGCHRRPGYQTELGRYNIEFNVRLACYRDALA